MELQPRRQPGRIDRKAAAYALEIARLRSAGYTYEAIREALADVGIELSTSGLRREVCRLRKPSAVTLPAPESGAQAGEQTPSHAAPASALPSLLGPAAPVGFNGHEIAEAFFNANPSNPLIRS